MNNDITLINKLLYYPLLRDDISFNLISGGAIFFEKSACHSLLLILKELNKDSFAKNLIKIKKLLNNNFTCKIIGNEKFILKIKQQLTIQGIADSCDIVRQHGFELVFFPKINKLRVTKNLSSIGKVKKIKVLVVDDSPTIRTLLEKILVASGDFDVIGKIGDPLTVDHFLDRNTVDLITLDIHMPGINGVELLKNIFPKYHIPTVMISSIRIEEGPYIMEALEIGAIDYIEKPSLSELKSITPYIIEKLKAAAMSKVRSRAKNKKQFIQGKVKNKNGYLSQSLLLIGASTGGVEALKYILENLPNNIPPIIIVQHIPKVFSKALADRLDKLCSFKVKEAEDGEMIRANSVLIAPGGIHIELLNIDNTLKIKFNDTEEVNRFKPSIDVLFKSVAINCPRNTVAALLTGMGRDGAKGLLELNLKGVQTIAQDEKSCVVFGMPREAIELNAADYILPLREVPAKLIELVSK